MLIYIKQGMTEETFCLLSKKDKSRFRLEATKKLKGYGTFVQNVH